MYFDKSQIIKGIGKQEGGVAVASCNILFPGSLGALG